jgi:hypothetical protein
MRFGRDAWENPVSDPSHVRLSDSECLQLFWHGLQAKVTVSIMLGVVISAVEISR